MGYVAQVAAAGVDAVTLMPWSGPNGLSGGAGGDAPCSPAYFALARLRAPARRCHVSVSQPTRLAALALSRDARRELLLANLTGETIEVELDGWPAQQAAALLDATSWNASALHAAHWDAAPRVAAAQRLCLAPYALAAIEQAG